MKNGDFLSVYGTSASPSNYRIGERQENLGNGDIYVFKCQFIECKATGSSDGGAIFVSSSESTKMLLESSNFIRCRTERNAGAIYFAEDGSCVFSKVCGFGCYTTGTEDCYMFDYICCSKDLSYKNQINDTTVTHSINENSMGSMEHDNGIALFKSLNSSLNKCNHDPGMYCNFYKSMLISFCSLDNNTASTSSIVLVICHNTKKCEMKFSNIVKNNHVQDSTEEGIILAEGDLVIKDSCIIENEATYTFYERLKSCSITVDNCTLDEDIESKTGNYVMITNISSSSFINALVHLTTGNCVITKKRRNFCQTRKEFWKMRRTVDITQIMALILVPSFIH